jgi:hypothetical protein
MVENTAKDSHQRKVSKISIPRVSDSVYESANEAKGRSGCWMRDFNLCMCARVTGLLCVNGSFTVGLHLSVPTPSLPSSKRREGR